MVLLGTTFWKHGVTFKVESFQNEYKFLIQRPKTVFQFLNKSGVQSTFKQIISLIII